MSETDPRIHAFFDRDSPWKSALGDLRAILKGTPLIEDFKWGDPCYTLAGGNVVTLWAMKDRCALAFFKGALLSDPDKMLVAPGENSRAMRRLDFTGPEQIAADRDRITSYLAEAIRIEEAGEKVTFAKDDLDYPQELIDRLDSDAEFRSAFEALTPGRRRGWILHFAQPKQEKTRRDRIDKAAPRILSGKGPQDR